MSEISISITISIPPNSSGQPIPACISKEHLTASVNAMMTSIFSFFILPLMVPLVLPASFATSVLQPRHTAALVPVSISLPLDNVTLLQRDEKPGHKTEGFECIRNSGCALQAYKEKCGDKPNPHIPGCSSEYPTAKQCCGKTYNKDHPCNLFWPESQAQCEGEMKHQDCHRTSKVSPICVPINTRETPEQCALKAHCAAKSWDKACSKWWQELFHPIRCGTRLGYEFCCLPRQIPKHKGNNFNLPPACKRYWPKDLNDCGKGCKAEVGGKVTCQKEKRDRTGTSSISTSDVSSSDKAHHTERSRSTLIKGSRSEGRISRSPVTLQPPPMPSNATLCGRNDRSWSDGDPIPPVTDCRTGTRCALAAWKTSCDKWYQKFSSGCWQRAPAYHTYCNGHGERKPPQNDGCSVRWPSNEKWCQDTLRAWDCRDDVKGNLVCERAPNVPTITGN
jgi:hypothetical protein